MRHIGPTRPLSRLERARARARRADLEADRMLAAWDAGAATSAELEIAEARRVRAWLDVAGLELHERAAS